MVVLLVIKKTPTDPATNKSVNLRPWAAIPLVLALIFGFISVYRSVGAREVGIPVSFGSIGSDLQSGIYIVAPWTTVTKCPLSEEQSIQNADPHSGDAVYNQSVPISGSDQGGATADVSFYYHINRQDAGAIYRSYACNTTKIKDNLVAQQVRSAVGTAATQFISVDLKSHRADIEVAALTGLRSSLTSFGLTSDKVVIADLILNPNVQNAANAKLAAQQSAQTATFKLQQAQVDAQTAVVQAQGQQNANTAKQLSLTPNVLCSDLINALGSPNSRITVLNTLGPCGGTVATGGTGTIVNAGG